MPMKGNLKQHTNKLEFVGMLCYEKIFFEIAAPLLGLAMTYEKREFPNSVNDCSLKRNKKMAFEMLCSSLTKQ